MEKKNHFPLRGGSLNRRSFLKLSGLLGVGVASVGLAPITAEAVRFNRRLLKVSETRLAMGTVVSMTLLHPSRDRAQEAMGRAFEEINRLTRTLSRFDDATAVSQLNKEGSIRDLPPEVAHVILRALRYYHISGGYFDITVKPVVDLFKRSFEKKHPSLPSENDLRRALRLVDARKVTLRGRTISFQEPGMGITLDGIAKGFIVDRASRVLSDFGIHDHLINAGGDIRTSGNKAGKRPWSVAIQDPLKKGNYPDIIRMRDGAIATSGNYEVYYDREKMFHHIVDPRTGYSPEQDTSVSVLADRAIDADALSTAVFVMSPEKGIRFIEGMPRRECFIVTRSGRKLHSSGWKGTRV